MYMCLCVFVSGPVSWRMVVVVGGGLTLFQDVFVSVKGAEGVEGGGGQDRGECRRRRRRRRRCRNQYNT